MRTGHSLPHAQAHSFLLEGECFFNSGSPGSLLACRLVKAVGIEGLKKDSVEGALNSETVAVGCERVEGGGNKA